MNEKPILFSTEMVKAILDGRKTQTRRVIPRAGGDCLGYITDRDAYWFELDLRTAANGPETSIEAKCPYGRPGDLLWVRETWKPGAWRDDGRIAIDYKASPELTKTPWLTIPEEYPGKQFDELWEQWTNELRDMGWFPDKNGVYQWESGQSPLKWRPSIFMPRWASRITLRMTDVWVERVQEISEADVQREGWFFQNHDLSKRYDPVTMDTARQWFAELWDSVNAKRGFSWDSNPWVWVVEFEEVKK